MRVAIVLTVLSVLVAPPDAAAQPWREAYDRGDFARAAAFLETLVFDRPWSQLFPDADAAEALAIMYAEGRREPQDRVLACSLLDLASRAAMNESLLGEPHPRFGTRRDEVCGSLTPAEREEAGKLMGCVRFGPDLQAFSLDPGHWVELSRHGIRVHYLDAETQQEWTDWCGQRFTYVRHVRVDPTVAGNRTRHFLELFSSILKGDVTPTQRLPLWQLFEIVGGSVLYRATNELPNEPRRASGVDYSPVRFRMPANGEVQWRFEDLPVAGVVEELPEVIARDEFPPIKPHSGRIDVTVMDRSGVPMADVRVTLSGVVSSALQTSTNGTVTFADLPDGRYDVVGAAKGFTNSPPRVLDVSGLAMPVEIVLKPPARKGSMSISCGMAPPRTLDALAAESDAIVHVKIERERSFRRAPRSDSDEGEIVTAFETRWIESFKVSSKVRDSDEILQRGGTLDDGEQSESHMASPYAPLNVGDEYVLFLKRYDQNWLAIYYATEGAFRIRNGRVEPLGSSKLASGWRDRSAKKFLEALRTSLKARTTGRG